MHCYCVDGSFVLSVRLMCVCKTLKSWKDQQQQAVCVQLHCVHVHVSVTVKQTNKKTLFSLSLSDSHLNNQALQHYLVTPALQLNCSLSLNRNMNFITQLQPKHSLLAVHQTV